MAINTNAMCALQRPPEGAVWNQAVDGSSPSEAYGHEQNSPVARLLPLPAKRFTPMADARDEKARREEIEQRAYQRFSDRGYERGADLDDWLAAEREVLVEKAAVRPDRASQAEATPEAASQTAGSLYGTTVVGAPTATAGRSAFSSNINTLKAGSLKSAWWSTGQCARMYWRRNRKTSRNRIT